MSVIVDLVENLYKTYINLKPDPYVEGWFSMDSLWLSTITMLIYLMFVICLGPIWMRNRKAFNLKKPILLYNAFIVLYCSYLSYKILTVDNTMKWVFYPTTYYTFEKEKQIEVCKLTWLYHIAKYIELLDTVFFVLRKKNNQVSSLHVFHHCDILLYTWVTTKYAPGLHFVAILTNSIVHVVMYTYYFIAILGPKYQKYIWWKKYLTALQLVQFVIIISHSMTMYLRDFGPNRPTLFYDGLNSAIFLVLFERFYRKTYAKTKAQ